ncbi:hypothetical protein SAMN06893096_109118 [Geodermatophilus pulveris]|uniref:Uncharacterized protein n=1 Tax=Geodermatophilus pulveris TaxID=1564159 RepID=A0A239HYP1_9ACTN|nr:hypothetical protein [Geodermatophilus pulveris]SNS86507.1 hypothetical protein SAMN06893096_109118 [Geodermatophilus pulveris]
MSDPQPATGGTGPSEDNLVDGVTGEDRSDGGERDEVTLTTDDDAQDDDAPVKPGNS